MLSGAFSKVEDAEHGEASLLKEHGTRSYPDIVEIEVHDCG